MFNGRVRVALALAVAIASAGMQGCGDDDEKSGGSSATATPTPTATPEPGPPHSIMRVGSTEPLGGMLTVDNQPTAFLVPNACLGGTGETCEGGVVVYGGSSPGFNNLNEENPAQPIYQLPDGVEVRIELTAAETDASVRISGVTLDAAGEEAVVNTTPELHNHPAWQFAAPGGSEIPEDRHLSFRLHADGFESSEEISLTLRVFQGEDGGHHD